MSLLRYIFRFKGAFVVVLVLLMVQAFADLSLPNLTSQIVDVGIQQAGIEHVTVDQMTASTYDQIRAMLNDKDDELLTQAYEPTDEGTYRLTDFGRQHLAELDELLAYPLIVIHKPEVSGISNWPELMESYNRGELDREDLIKLIDEGRARLAGSDGTSSASDDADVAMAAMGAGSSASTGSAEILQQQGIAAARDEYEALGYDLTGMQMNFFLRVGATMLGLAALVMASSIAVGFVASRTGARLGFELRNELFARVVAFSEREIEHFSAASLITRGTNDITLIQNVTIMSMRMVLYAPILAIGGIIMVMVTNASLGWIIVVAIVLVIALIGIVFAIATPKFRIMQSLIDKVNLVAREMLTGLPVIRAFDREPYEEDRFDRASTKLMRTQLFTNRVMTFMGPLMTLIMNAVSVAIVWFGGLAVDNGTLQTGDLIAFITYSMVIIMGFLMIGMISIMLPRADVAARRIADVLATEPSVLDEAQPHHLEKHAGGVEIAFHHVSFAYGDSDENVLSDITFTAKPGKTLAIIGPTGSGKSTIMKLMERFYDVSEGSITVDGVDMRSISQKELRTTLGYVPQRAFLFSGTVESNIAYGEGELPEDEIWHVLDIAQASDFVREREEGLDTPIAQGGTNVSGGQRQRLAIARALATGARAFLFDDSFSALDYKTDALLRAELDKELAGVTKIIVAQRIATIMQADTIVVIDDGRIVGEGTHEELLASCPEYLEIAQSQLSPQELGEVNSVA